MRSALQYKQLLKSLYPKGKAFSRETGTVHDQYNHACAEEMARIDAREQDLIKESRVLETTELLSEHETDYGINNSELTDAERREILHSKLIATGGLWSQYYIDMMTTLGYTIDISEYKPAWVGEAVVGDTVGDLRVLFNPEILLDASIDFLETENIFNLSQIKADYSTALNIASIDFISYNKIIVRTAVNPYRFKIFRYISGAWAQYGSDCTAAYTAASGPKTFQGSSQFLNKERFVISGSDVLRIIYYDALSDSWIQEGAVMPLANYGGEFSPLSETEIVFKDTSNPLVPKINIAKFISGAWSFITGATIPITIDYVPVRILALSREHILIFEDFSTLYAVKTKITNCYYDGNSLVAGTSQYFLGFELYSTPTIERINNTSFILNSMIYEHIDGLFTPNGKWKTLFFSFNDSGEWEFEETSLFSNVYKVSQIKIISNPYLNEENFFLLFSVTHNPFPAGELIYYNFEATTNKIDNKYTQNQVRNIYPVIEVLDNIKPAHEVFKYNFSGIEFSRAFGFAYDSIPTNDATIAIAEYSSDFNSAFTCTEEYDGMYLSGAFSHGFDLSVDAHFGGAFDDSFDSNYFKPI